VWNKNSNKYEKNKEYSTWLFKESLKEIVELIIISSIGISLYFINSAYFDNTLNIVVIILFIATYYQIRSKWKREDKISKTIDYRQAALISKQAILRDQISSIAANQISYKLDISFEPNWVQIYKNIHNLESIDEAVNQIRKKNEDAQDIDLGLIGTFFRFTEFYDSTSGQTVRFREKRSRSGKLIQSGFVDDFEFQACLFASDSERSKIYDDWEKNFYRISEDSLVNNPNEYRHNENYILNFPLDAIVSFLKAVFVDLGHNYTIIKWSDRIEKELKENNFSFDILYDRIQGSPGSTLEIQKDFANNWGNPKLGSRDHGSTYIFSNELFGSYSIKIQFFRPNHFSSRFKLKDLANKSE
jgi:hypothetical protein